MWITLICIYLFYPLGLHCRNQIINRNMLHQRTQLQLNTQAKNLFVLTYERYIGVNLYGNLPMRTDQNYARIKRECITICDRWNDVELKKEIETNF